MAQRGTVLNLRYGYPAAVQFPHYYYFFGITIKNHTVTFEKCAANLVGSKTPETHIAGEKKADMNKQLLVHIFGNKLELSQEG